MGEKPALKKKSGSKLPHSMRSYLRDKVYHSLEICQEQFCPRDAAAGYLRMEEPEPRDSRRPRSPRQEAGQTPELELLADVHPSLRLTSNVTRNILSARFSALGRANR